MRTATSRFRASPAEPAKVSLHDHLDGALRPATIIELADAIGLEVPESGPAALGSWFAKQSGSGSLVEYLKTFDLTTAVMRAGPHPGGARVRAGPRGRRRDLRRGALGSRAAPGSRPHPRADRGSRAAGHRGRRGCRRPRGTQHPCRPADHRHAAHRPCPRDRRARGRLPRPRRRGLRHRRSRRRLPAVEPTRRSTSSPRTSSPSRCMRERRQAPPPSARLCWTDAHCGSDTVCASRRTSMSSRRRATRCRCSSATSRWVRDREIPLELSPSSGLQTGAIAAVGQRSGSPGFDLLYQLQFAVTVNVDNHTMSATSHP